MKMIRVLLVIFLSITTRIYAQTPMIEWLINDSTIVDFDIDTADNILALKKKTIGYEIDKYDIHGSLIWVKSDTFNISNLKRIKIDHSGNICILGNQQIFDKSTTFYVGQDVYKKFDFYYTSLRIAKYDTKGNIIQNIKYKSTSSISGINIKSLSFDSENNLILCANTLYGDIIYIDTSSIGWCCENVWPSGSINFNAKINKEGNIIWLKEYPYYVTPNKTIIDDNDNIITAGYSRCELISDSTYDTGCYGLEDGVIIKYNKFGNILWTNHLGSKDDDEIIDISINKKKELTFLLNVLRDTIGKYDNITFQSGGMHDPYGGSKFIFKINENGELIWYKPLNQWSVSDKLDIVNSNFNDLLGLNFENTLQYDSLTFNSSIGNNGCIIKIDSIGNPIWSKQFGSGLYYNLFEKILIDRSENAFVLGSYYSPIIIDDYNLTSNKGKFLCKILNDSLTYTKINYFTTNNQLIIYPNPANSIVTIKSNEIMKEADLILYNLNGQELLKKKIKSSYSIIDITNLSDGIYLLKLKNNKQVMIGKIIKK